MITGSHIGIRGGGAVLQGEGETGRRTGVKTSTQWGRRWSHKMPLLRTVVTGIPALRLTFWGRGMPLVPPFRVTLGPTSEELLLLAEAVALLVTDLTPVFCSELLHGQLQVLLLLGYKVPVLREGTTRLYTNDLNDSSLPLCVKMRACLPLSPALVCLFQLFTLCV